MAQFFPMIQTHTMEMEPYLKNCQGYAFFVSSPRFSGKEVVTVTAPENTLLPDIGTRGRVLTQYSGKQWYISDQERIVSAQGGSLAEGTYTISIQTETQTHIASVDYEKSFLSVPQNIHLKDLGSHIDLNWTSDPKSNTSWIFAFPVDTKDILNDLIAVSSVMHVGDSYRFEKSVLKPGIYKIAIRSNQLWEGGTFWGIQSEAWAISSQEFVVNE